MSIRPVKRLVKAKPALEGAGVHLRRAFGFGTTSDFDPFLLLDDFRNDRPEDYLTRFHTVVSGPLAGARPPSGRGVGQAEAVGIIAVPGGRTDKGLYGAFYEAAGRVK
jgi:hypothetical protein